MKNYYKILGVRENASTEEIIYIGNQLINGLNVEHKFAGKRFGIDYGQKELDEANYIYRQVVEAYQVLTNEQQRAEYNRALREYGRQQHQPSLYYQNMQGGYNTQRNQVQQNTRSNQNYPTTQNRQQNPKYTRSRTDNTMERSPKRGRRQKGTFGKMIDSFKEVRKDERAYPLFERHQDLNKRIREEYHNNIKSVPGEIVYTMANGTLHVTYEFIHQLKKLSYLNEDTAPKYVFRNRKLAAAALAVALMASSGGGDTNEIVTYPTPQVTITQEMPTPTEQPVVEQQEVVYEEPTMELVQLYEVVRGDTLSEISTRTGVKVYEIQEANNRIGSDKIYSGETLILPYTIDREDLQYYTMTVPAKGITCKELAKKYRTDEETIRRLNKEAIAYINTGYTILTDTAVVPSFITVEELDIQKSQSASHNY